MKQLFLLIATICLALTAYTQSEVNLPKTDATVGEVSVTPPEFTGIPNYAEFMKSDPNQIREYLRSQVVYPEEAASCQKQGTELVTFTVTAEGNLENIRIVNHVCPAIDQEMIRVLKTTDEMWKPGLRDGSPVDMEQELYLVFSMCGNLGETGCIFQKKLEQLFTAGTKQMYDKGHFKRAEKIFDQAIVLWPFEANTLLMRGICRFENGDKIGAYDDWDRVNSLTGIDLTKKEYSEAIKELDGYKEFLSMYNKK